MSQHDYTIANQGFPATRADINNALSAIATNNSGTSAPSTQYAGQFWIDTTSSTWTLYIHDGTDDIQFATIDTSANTVNFIDSALDVVTDTSPQLGGNLDLNSNDITGTGNINITGTIESSGNITGTLATASQPNITSVGTLTSFTSTGIDDNATSTAITINSSERVGIGTSSPGSAKLQVTDGTDINVRIGSLGSVPAVYAINDAGSYRNFRIDANPLIINTYSGGNVGIGTTTPSQKLDVVGSIEVSDGIYIGGTGTANKLDDYEEGTFTPTIAGTTTAGTGTYSNQQGQYTKVGDICFVNIFVQWSAHTGTGDMKISNLPFTSIAGSPPGSAYQAVIPLTIGISFTGNIEMQLRPDSTDLFYYQNNNGSETQITLDTVGLTIATFVYKTA